jgi:hypothetical protein
MKGLKIRALPRWPAALFFVLSTLASAMGKKEHGRAKKMNAEKAKASSVKDKSREFALFPPFAASHWKLGSKVKSSQQGEKQGS